MKDNTITAMEQIASIAPHISRKLTEMNFSAYFLGSQIWVRSNADPEVDMTVDMFCANICFLCAA